MNHKELILRESSEEPQEYSLSGILYSLKYPNKDGCSTAIDCGAYVPCRYISFFDIYSFIPKLKNRIKLAWEVLCGRADILYYK